MNEEVVYNYLNKFEWFAKRGTEAMKIVLGLERIYYYIIIIITHF